MSFLSVLKTIGTDIEKGLAIATPIVGEFVPVAGPILAEIATVISALENAGKTLTAEQLSQVIQSITAVNAVKQSAAPAASAAPEAPITMTITRQTTGNPNMSAIIPSVVAVPAVPAG